MVIETTVLDVEGSAEYGALAPLRARSTRTRAIAVHGR